MNPYIKKTYIKYCNIFHISSFFDIAEMAKKKCKSFMKFFSRHVFYVHVCVQ